jgi:hypothetical protein
MQVVHPVCCGLDVHQATLTACVRRVSDDGQITTTLREFGTIYSELLALSDWLVTQRCPVVAMESTGVYVRRITARAISLAEGTGSGGNPWVNDSPGDESQRGQQHVGEAERPRSRVWSGSARPVCYGESLVA